LMDKETNMYANFQIPVGWRVDCIGDIGFWADDQNGWSHMYDFYPQEIINAGVKNDVNVARGTNPNPPLTVPVELVIDGGISSPPYTNKWLIYNEIDADFPPSPFYKVRFIGKAKWTGEGQTGNVIELEASYKKSQRVDW